MTAAKAKAPAPSNRLATLDDLRKATRQTARVRIRVEEIPAPQPLGAKASAEERKLHAKRLEEWEAAVEAAKVDLTIQGMSRRQYAQLMEAHPPTDKQIEDAQRRGQPVPQVNEDTHAPALIAESIIEPAGVTLEDAKAMWEDWDYAQAVTLYTWCKTLNETFRMEFYQKKSGTTGG